MKHYQPEFKADAVALYRSRPGVTIAQIAADLGVNSETLRNWIRIDDRRRGTAPAAKPTARPAAGDPADPAEAVAAENAALRRRVRELEEERDILRKAARYIAGETRW
ncbi:transposase [Dactylosporangium sp. NPDC000521]|uniref:transposase n=1 Tax=Dactylosporangium sp. NPDC000521 TaxID=3363975 RepID=UPI0036D12388